MLRVAAATMQTSFVATYRTEAKAEGLNRLIQRLQEKGVPKRGRFASLIPLFSQPMLRPLVLAFAVVFLVSVAATGTTMASSNAVPGDPLYWVKTTKETVSLNLVPRSDIEKAEAHAILANERAEEVRTLILRGRYDAAERHVRKIRIQLSEAAGYAGVVIMNRSIDGQPYIIRINRDEQRLAHLRELLERQRRDFDIYMQDVLQQAPSVHQQKVEQLMRQPQLDFRIMIRAIEGSGFPGQRQFWRNVPANPIQ